MTTIIKSDNITMNIHPINYVLNSKWSYYFHNIKDNNWKLDSYQHIYTFTNIEEFWRLFNIHPKYSFGFFFMMRDGISPIWEDESNINGGTFSFKITKDNISDAWLELSVALIGETITKNSENISGISLHPKYNCFIIKIWCITDTQSLIFSTNLRYFDSTTCLYKKNKVEEKSH